MAEEPGQGSGAAGGPRPPAPPAKRSTLLRATGSMAVPTLISRITGFVKLVLVAAVLGPAVGSAFNLANTLPNLVAELVLGAVLVSIVVPVLVRAEAEDDDGGALFTRRLLTICGTILVVTTLAAVLAAPLLIDMTMDPESKVNRQLALAFAYLLLPQISFYGLTALYTAVLNTRGVFAPGAWAPVVNNVVAIATLGGYMVIWNTPDNLSSKEVLFIGLGTTLGIVAQAAVLLPSLRRAGVDMRPEWGLDARIKASGGMALAILVYVVISQVGWVVTMRIATAANEGAALIYSTVWLLLQVPYGVLGVAVLTAIMPQMSRNAAAGNNKAVVDDLTAATKLTMIALIPVIALFMVAGELIAVTLFSFGNFSVTDAEQLGGALVLGAFSLVPYALGLLHLRVFYARQEAWIPNLLVVALTAVKVGFALLAPQLANDPGQVVAFLHFANGMGFAAGAALGVVVLRRRLGNMRLTEVAKTMLLVSFAAVAGGAVWLLALWSLPVHALRDHLGRLGMVITLVLASIVVLGVSYGLLALFKVPEVTQVVGGFSRLFAKVRGRVRPPVVSDKSDGSDPSEKPAPSPSDDPVSEWESPRQQPGKPQGLPYSEPQNPTPEGHGPHPSGPGGGAQPSGWAEGHTMSDSASALGTADTTSPAQDGGQPDPATRPHPTAWAGQRGPRLIPGAAVAGGRYRLIEEHGGARGLRFWQARDLKLERDVALTFVNADQFHTPGAEAGDTPEAMLNRTLRLARVNSPGLARVLDVVRGSSGGIVVAEWASGRSLREIAATNPSPTGAARAVRALAGAAEAAHRSGATLSIDHPDRIRISAAGDAVLAFPATAADTDQAADVHGLGATLYALVTGHWPLAEPAAAFAPGHSAAPRGHAEFAGPGAVVGGLPAADLTEAGVPVDPRRLRAVVPYEISAVAVRALQTGSGIRTAATVQQILDQATMADQATDMLPVIQTTAAKERPRASTIKPTSVVMTAEERRKRARKVIVILTLLGALSIGILGFGISKVASMWVNGGAETPVSEQPLGLTTGADGRPVEPSRRLVTLKPVDITVYSPEQTADNPASAEFAIDGDTTTRWSTAQYYEQFPQFKNGVGLIVTFESPVNLDKVEVETTRPGTHVQIRTASDADPDLDSTRLVGEGTLGAGRTPIILNPSAPTEHVLVWIDKLSTEGGSNQSNITELVFTGEA